MAEVVKTGYVKRYSKSFLDSGWNNVWLVLHKDSNLVIYNKQGDSKPKAHVYLKDVCRSKYFAYGTYTDGMPDRPDLGGNRSALLLAVPQKPSSQPKMHWFMCSKEEDVHAWMSAICSTLPPPPTPSSHPAHLPAEQPIQPTQASNVSAGPPMPGPPPPYSTGPPQPPPPGGIGFHTYAGAPPAYPAQPYAQQAYPGQPYPNTQPYPQPPGQPNYAQQPYPQQNYYTPQQANAGYPRQQYAPPPPGYAAPPGGYYPQQQYAGYPQQQYAGYPQQQYAGAQQPNVVYVQGKKNKGILGSNTGKTAAALIGGAALGYGATRMMGGFGGWGCGRWGSWSSLSSFGSCGSFGSFGSFSD